MSDSITLEPGTFQVRGPFLLRHAELRPWRIVVRDIVGGAVRSLGMARFDGATPDEAQMLAAPLLDLLRRDAWRELPPVERDDL